MQSHNDFISKFGINVDMDCQEIPYYKGTVKMHKNPPDTRFLSSSERSSMLPISKGLTGLFKAIQLEVPPLFASALQSMHIHESWTARCWVLEDTAAVMPLLHMKFSVCRTHVASP